MKLLLTYHWKLCSFLRCIHSALWVLFLSVTLAHFALEHASCSGARGIHPSVVLPWKGCRQNVVFVLSLCSSSAWFHRFSSVRLTPFARATSAVSVLPLEDCGCLHPSWFSTLTAYSKNFVLGERCFFGVGPLELFVRLYGLVPTDHDVSCKSAGVENTAVTRRYQTACTSALVLQLFSLESVS